MEIIPDNAVCLLVGIGEIAYCLIIYIALGTERKRLCYRVTGLQFHFGKVNTSAVDSGRCTGLKSTQGQAQFTQTVGQANGGMHAVRACGLNGFTNDNGTIQISTGGDDHSLCCVLCAQLGAHTAHMTICHENIRDLRLL